MDFQQSTAPAARASTADASVTSDRGTRICALRLLVCASHWIKWGLWESCGRRAVTPSSPDQSCARLDAAEQRSLRTGTAHSAAPQSNRLFVDLRDAIGACAGLLKATSLQSVQVGLWAPPGRMSLGFSSRKTQPRALQAAQEPIFGASYPGEWEFEMGALTPVAHPGGVRQLVIPKVRFC